MKKIVVYFVVAVIAAIKLVAQNPVEVYPTNWWAGMKMNKIQIMLHETRPGFIIAVDKLVINSSSPD
ncbi:MAG: cyclomaltodextrinase N-terminal domain-containing protein, partial [Bacteroidota bacterium]